MTVLKTNRNLIFPNFSANGSDGPCGSRPVSRGGGSRGGPSTDRTAAHPSTNGPAAIRSRVNHGPNNDRRSNTSGTCVYIIRLYAEASFLFAKRELEYTELRRRTNLYKLHYGFFVFKYLK